MASYNVSTNYVLNPTDSQWQSALPSNSESLSILFDEPFHADVMQAHAELLMAAYSSYQMYGSKASLSDRSWDDSALLLHVGSS